MEARRLGKSDLAVQPVVLGTWAIGGWFWGGTDDEAAIAAIRASFDAGIRAIDTAPIYGRGHSERIVGQAIRGMGDEVLVFTKVGLRWDDSGGTFFFHGQDADRTEFDCTRNLRPESVRWEVDQSLRRLKVERLDLVQCHWPDPATPIGETMGALSRLVEEGKVRAVGVSNFDVAQLQDARAALEREGRILASDQPPYSLLDRRLEEAVLPWCRDREVGVLAYSPMARGLLSGKMSADRVFHPADGRASSPLYSAENRRRVAVAIEQTSQMAGAMGCTVAQLAVAWVHSQPGVTAALVGARNPEQARENAAAAALRLGDGERAWLADVFGSVELER